MTTIVDATVDAQGTVHLLTDEGTILAQRPADSLAHQHLPPSQRPKHEWQTISGPDAVVPHRVLCGAHGTLYVVADGLLFERTRDQDNLLRSTYSWKPVPLPGAEPEAPVNPPSPTRTKILTADDHGNRNATRDNAVVGEARKIHGAL